MFYFPPTLGEWLSVFQIMSAIVGMVALPLIYFQLKHMERTTKGQTYASISKMQSDLNLVMFDNADFARKLKVGNYKTKDEDGVKLLLLVHNQFNAYEYLFFQQELGNITREMWKAWQLEIVEFAERDAVNPHWNEFKNHYYEGFRVWLDSELKRHKEVRCAKKK